MKLLIATLVASVVLAVPAFSASFDERNFAKLQSRYAKGVADPIPWAGYWWPYDDGGIGDAAEKIDDAFNVSNYASAWERQRHGEGRNAANWWGHCNGWATAAIMESEPRSAVSRNGVRFGIDDRKALLSEYWMESGSDFIGRRVWNSRDRTSAAFWDVVPAAFHLLLTNIVGRNRQSVIIDRYTGAEVWNQPLAAYQVYPITREDDLGPHPRYRNLHRVNVTTTIWWLNDEVEPDDLTPEFRWKDDDFFEKRTLRYELWLDAPPEFDSSGKLVASGNIVLTNRGVGGQWKNGLGREALLDSHPDFMWIPLSYKRSSGYKNPRIRDAWVKQNLAD